MYRKPIPYLAMAMRARVARPAGADRDGMIRVAATAPEGRGTVLGGAARSASVAIPDRRANAAALEPAAP